MKYSGNSRYIPFAAIIMQAILNRSKYATVSRVETVKADNFPHRGAALTADGPIHSTGLSCRISPSRPLAYLTVYVFWPIVDWSAVGSPTSTSTSEASVSLKAQETVTDAPFFTSVISAASFPLISEHSSSSTSF